MINAESLTLLLGKYFPYIEFFRKTDINDLDILRYVHDTKDGWTLDLKSMSKNENFSHLFHNDFSIIWDEAAAIDKSNHSDVIKYCIDFENDKYLKEFSKMYRNNIEKYIITNKFLDDLDYYDCKPVWKEWDFSILVLHKPHTIYKAFYFYAHKLYTLMGFGIHNNNSKHDIEKLLFSGNTLLDETIKEKIPEVSSLNINRQIKFYKLKQEVLESVPTGQSVYNPTKIDIYMEQLKGQLPNIYKKDSDDINELERGNYIIVDYDMKLFNPAEKATINNHIIKIGKYIDFNKLNELEINGTYREKINFLYDTVMKEQFHMYYSDREREIIDGLYKKHLVHGSMDDSKSKNGEEGLSVHEYISENKYLLIDEHLTWTSFFENVFKLEFSKSQMEYFLECIPDHFNRYPFSYKNDSKDLEMSKYSENILFSIFCKILDITEDKEIKKHFLYLIRETVNNINIARTEIGLRSS
ncbi:MAG: hypothetical protein FWD47_08910 [Treponema sp.]|nr:hypothetical protein [Treponema sp.]